MQNAWFGVVGGNRASVYAGALLDDPDQGAIAVVIVYPYRNIVQKIPTPTRHGQVSVVSEQHNRLTLAAAYGTIFYFDVPARRFLDSPNEIVQTAAPPPTYTPYAPHNWPTVTLPGGYPYPLRATQGTAAP